MHRIYVATYGFNFYDNAKCHTHWIGKKMFEMKTIPRMEKLVYSPHLNPINHI